MKAPSVAPDTASQVLADTAVVAGSGRGCRVTGATDPTLMVLRVLWSAVMELFSR